ncbi:MAG: multiheme c-type cytochrome [Nitrospirota bacterium]
MMKYVFKLLLLAALSAVSIVFAEEKGEVEDCISCHNRETPNLIRTWKGSAHAGQDISCTVCHGKNYDENHLTGSKRQSVEAHVCAGCHDGPVKEHFAGKHGVSFRAGLACTRNVEKTPEILAGCNDCHEEGSALPRHDIECARFLAQSPAMQRQGCLSCHKIENRCDACHTPHDTDLKIVRDPAVCGTCHMGPDHPQYEMWKSSRHGVMFAQKGRDYAPDCTVCHMADGTHNVSEGVSMGIVGQKYQEHVRKSERDKMLKVCSKCHARSFAEVNLQDGDTIQRESKALIDEAASIIRDLDREGLLVPAPSERPPHPLRGKALEIGPQMLYEDLSRVEAVFFRMKKFYYIITYKGVFHQNPDYAHWYGNAPLKLALSEIKSEAETLRELKRLRDRIDNLSALGLHESSDPEAQKKSLKTELRQLKELYLRKDLSESEYEKRRDEIMKKYGL